MEMYPNERRNEMGFIKKVLSVSGATFLVGLAILAVGSQLETVKDIKELSAKLDTLNKKDEEIPEF